MRKITFSGREYFLNSRLTVRVFIIRRKRDGPDRYSARRMLTASGLAENMASSSLSNLISPDGQVVLLTVQVPEQVAGYKQEKFFKVASF